MSNRLRLYGTLGCHLCEQAEATVRALMTSSVDLKHIDIADEESLVAQYGRRIPVLALGAQEHDWPFDEHTLLAMIEQASMRRPSAPCQPSDTARRVWHIGLAKK